MFRQHIHHYGLSTVRQCVLQIISDVIPCVTTIFTSVQPALIGLQQHSHVVRAEPFDVDNCTIKNHLLDGHLLPTSMAARSSSEVSVCRGGHSRLRRALGECEEN